MARLLRPIRSKSVHSGADTIKSTSSSQHQRERHTDTIKQPQEDGSNIFETMEICSRHG